MQFDYSTSSIDRQVYPATDKSFFSKKDRELSYHEFVDLVKFLWEKGHPDIELVPLKNNGISDRQRGYVVYMLENRKPVKDYAKPRVRETIKDSASGEEIQVSVQVFSNIISFSAVHEDPRVAEEIIEAFEEFMQECTSIFHQNGISNIFYYMRYPDGKDARIGEDVAVRKVGYTLLLEKITLTAFSRIEAISLDIRVFKRQYRELEKATPDFNSDIIDNRWDSGQ